MGLDIFAPQIVIDEAALSDTGRRVGQALDDNLSDTYMGHEVFLKGGLHLAAVPSRPLPSTPGTGELVARGYVQYLSGLEDHARFVEGRMARPVEQGPSEVALVEAVVSTATADFYDLGIDDRITLAPELRSRARIQATVVGIVEPDDSQSDYWDFAAALLSPGPIDEVPPRGIRVAPPDPGEPPVALFIGRQALTDAIGAAFPGAVVRPIWFALVDNERLGKLSPSEARYRVEGLASDLARLLPGSSVAGASFLSLVEGVERRAFFSRVPLLILLAPMVTTVFFYLSMVVGYLTKSREKDTALLTTRGAGTLQLSRIYLLEAIAVAALGAAAGPFLAFGSVTLLGRLPFFTAITGGSSLPVTVTPAPFLAALAAGATSVVVMAVPGVLGVRLGVLLQRLKVSRPTSQGILHRRHADIAFLALGGLAFWELHSRGHFMSGGLFNDVGVNKTLLLAPVFFLVVAALVFVRLFPVVVRFVAGESPALVHIVAAATSISLAGLALLDAAAGATVAEWGPPVGIALAFGSAYWATARSKRRLPKTGWLIVQAALVAWFLFLRPPDPGELTFVPTIALMFMLPAQGLFALLRHTTRSAPVWMAIAIWHMARNPTRYTWLVLLLVLATGLAILATTVGGTLERSQREQILYEVVSDFRIDDLEAGGPTDSAALQDRIAKLPGVALLTPVLRLSGTIGLASFQVLGLEPDPFAQVAWYRKDFSAIPLTGVMAELGSSDRVGPIEFPDDATSLGMWVKSGQQVSTMALWAVLVDGTGCLTSVTLGKLDQTGWRLMTAEVPSRLARPVSLVAVQIFEPGQGNFKTPGEIYIDDIHVGLAGTGETVSLEGFEESMKWTAIESSGLSGERVLVSVQDAHEGNRAARFLFGSESVENIRGICRPPSMGPVPVVISESLQAATGAAPGSVLTAVIANRRLPVVVAGTVRYFPTMNPAGGFMLIDLDTLLGHINVLGPTHARRPNEFFVVAEPDVVPEVREGITGVLGFRGRVQDRSSRLDSVRLDPLASSGWDGMVLLAVSLAFLAATLGYIAYLLLSARLSRGEAGYLEAMGLSRRQLAALLIFEHLAVVVVALVLGTWAGFRMSALTVSPLAVTNAGNPVAPPFVLVTDWAIMALVYVALASVFVAALLVLTRTMGRLDLQAIARLGEP